MKELSSELNRPLIWVFLTMWHLVLFLKSDTFDSIFRSTRKPWQCDKRASHAIYVYRAKYHAPCLPNEELHLVVVMGHWRKACSLLELSVIKDQQTT